MGLACDFWPTIFKKNFQLQFTFTNFFIFIFIFVFVVAYFCDLWFYWQCNIQSLASIVLVRGVYLELLGLLRSLPLLPEGVKGASQGRSTRYLPLGAECADAPTCALGGKEKPRAHLKGFLDQEGCWDWVPSCSSFLPWCLWAGQDSLRLTGTERLPRLDHIPF